jgi:peptidoglycan/xylan/chitin deacetylase (PgdA/CDA1 family)
MPVIPRLPELLWRVYCPPAITNFKGAGKIIRLTFDDGPHPSVTPAVLDILAHFRIRATFFCTGENMVAWPGSFDRILSEGHSIGNHTYSHLNGWITPASRYFADIERCSQVYHSPWFRPPFGRITPAQCRYLSRQYQIVMWSLMTYDFRESFSPVNVLDIGLKKTKPGDIVVFHDNLRAGPRLLYALPRYIEAMLENGFTFGHLNETE